LETEGRSQDDLLNDTSLLEGAGSVVTETQEPMTDGFADKVDIKLSILLQSTPSHTCTVHRYKIKAELFKLKALKNNYN